MDAAAYRRAQDEGHSTLHAVENPLHISVGEDQRFIWYILNIILSITLYNFLRL